MWNSKLTPRQRVILFNIMISPLVLVLRLPIAVPCLILYHLADWILDCASVVLDWQQGSLPGFQRYPRETEKRI